jgi:hypothetical protein
VTAAVRQPTKRYDGYDAFTAGAIADGWSDGLPIVPPTAERVEKFLSTIGKDPWEVVGEIPTRDIEITAEQVAANAVMAGCLPAYMPVVFAAVQAHLHRLGNAHCVTATLTGASQMVIVNGPVRREIGINCGPGALGPGTRANATIGRAVRLVVRNCVQSVPGIADRAAYSTPARYSYCVGEDEEATSWDPMHVERGFGRDQSVATLNSMTDAFALFDDRSDVPDALLDRLVHLCRVRPINPDQYLGDERTMVILIGPEHRRILEEAGWSKADVRSYLYPKLTAPHTRGEGEIDAQGLHATGGPTESSLAISAPDKLLLITAGGQGRQLSWAFFPHIASAVSMPIPSPL